jgi:hypothetical protein
MADYLIAFQCSFVLRLHPLPPSERFNLADVPGAQPDPMDWVRGHLPPDRPPAFIAPPFNDTDWFCKGDDPALRDWHFGVPSEGNANFAMVQHLKHHLTR